MSTDSDRIQHDLHLLPSAARGAYLDQILSDLEEYIHGSGFEEVIRSGIWVARIDWYEDNTKAKLRASTEISRMGIFVDEVETEVFDQALGTTLIATITTVINRTGIFVDDFETTIVREDSPACPLP